MLLCPHFKISCHTHSCSDFCTVVDSDDGVLLKISTACIKVLFQDDSLAADADSFRALVGKFTPGLASMLGWTRDLMISVHILHRAGNIKSWPVVA